MEEKKQTVLTLKFIGIDDFLVQLMRISTDGSGKTFNLGKSETPDPYSTTGNDPGWGTSIPHPAGIYC